MVRLASVAWLAAAMIVASAGPTRGQDATREAGPPVIGAVAKDFKLLGINDKPVELGKLAKAGPVVVVVLRGYPGYQCPACVAQTASYLEHAKEFAELKAHVVLVYPGPAAELKQRAEEFLHEEKLPEPLVLALDPDFKFTLLYGLRWEAAHETAYPSTFVVDGQRKVKFRKVSKTHGDRAEVDDVLAALRAK